MKGNKLKAIIEASRVLVHQGRYAYLKCEQKPKGDYFMVSQDHDEVTVVAEEKSVANISYEKAVKWFKLIEFKVAKPFVSTGFLSKIAQAIANRKMNLLIVSTFSKDYVLVKEEKINDAVAALKKASFSMNIQRPKVKSMFGAIKGLKKWTKADRMDFHEW